MWQFPESDLSRGNRLLGLLGSFWSQMYDGRAVVQSVLQARAELEQQNWLNLMEAVAAFSRFDVPLFHKQNWHLQVLLQSDRGRRVPRYGTGSTFGSPGLLFGSQVSDDPLWTVPADLVRVPMIFNRLADPSVALTEGPDYTIDLASGVIRFREDPFDNPLFGTIPLFTDGVQTDTALFLWLFRGDFDWKYIYNCWGYILGASMKSSEAYRDLLNTIFDGLVSGTAMMQIQTAYAAMTGLPVVKERSETVEAVTEDRDGLIVVTDVHSYRIPPDATLAVSVGDSLPAGTSLTEELQFAETNTGAVPSWVRALTVENGLLMGRFHSELVFSNEDLPVVVGSDADGWTTIEFPIGGFPLDVEQFWDSLHASGKTAGRTLAHLMDQRTNQVGEPGASNLPATINPAEFLVQNVFRHNTLLVYVKTSGLADDAIGLHPARLLRRIVSPETLVLVLVEMAPSRTSVILNDLPNETTPGGSHSIGSFDGGDTVESMIGSDLMPSPRIAAWPVASVCM